MRVWSDRLTPARKRVLIKALENNGEIDVNDFAYNHCSVQALVETDLLVQVRSSWPRRWRLTAAGEEAAKRLTEEGRS